MPLRDSGKIRNATGSDSAPVAVAGQVYISSNAISPVSIPRTSGTATATVQVAVSTEVPAGTSVTVELFQQSNSGGAIMTITPTNGQRQITVSGGSPGTATFSLQSDASNPNSSNLVYKARIISVTSGNQAIPVTAGTSTDDTDPLAVQ